MNQPSPIPPVSHGMVRRVLLVGLMALVLLAVDVVAPYTNVPIAYLALLVVASLWTPRRLLWKLATIFALLTFVGLLLKTRLFGGTIDFGRVMNRGLVVGALLALVPVLRVWLPLKEDDDQPQVVDDFDRFLGSVLPLLGLLLAWGFSALVAVADLTLPAEVNLAILYCFSLVIASWAGSRRALWLTWLMLTALTVVGYWGGPGPEDSTAAPALLRNRLLVIAALAVLTVILHFAERRGTRPRLQPSSAVDTGVPSA